ncbi:hypothetical protein DTO166G4_9266 [Paecilomyces variotii]|nr:hypothetical protein DTO166G4_9266 [Paecilomyces variotii]KAJ9232808.1 hypothetical protein DTO169E5_7368 [Paecilomyces variotii]KAJ9234176.1 hypothetical protein DTO166G5_5237 [Paecilomyces variotii]KAJ9267865.1 hypothetical protein DTO195F2_199 [Paecilomyces variotii]KAJ9358751.1 hypothetical protein DTO280E4_4933 [Paecilomyces variotii]
MVAPARVPPTAHSPSAALFKLAPRTLLPLLFHDSYSATATAMTGLNTEYLVASAFESPASALILSSFTRRLIDLFKGQISHEYKAS